MNEFVEFLKFWVYAVVPFFVAWIILSFAIEFYVKRKAKEMAEKAGK